MSSTHHERTIREGSDVCNLPVNDHPCKLKPWIKNALNDSLPAEAVSDALVDLVEEVLVTCRLDLVGFITGETAGLTAGEACE